MLKKFLQKFKKDYEQAFNERLDQFDDPLAKSIDWGALKGGGTNFRTHTLKKDLHRFEYKATKMALFFGGIFAAVGALIPFLIIRSNIENGFSLLAKENLVIVAFGSIFLGVGLYMLKRFTTPITFDKHVGFYWKGKKQPEMYGRNNPDEAIKLSSIHALQLVAERVKGDNSSYFSYELNIITREGERFNIIDHGHQQSIYEDARALSEFLGVPVWDLNSTSDR